MRFLIPLAVAGALFAAEFSSNEYLEYVKYLASEQMRGRATGSPELAKAESGQAGTLLSARWWPTLRLTRWSALSTVLQSQPSLWPTAS